MKEAAKEAATGAAAPRTLGPVRTKTGDFYPKGDSLKETLTSSSAQTSASH